MERGEGRGEKGETVNPAIRQPATRFSLGPNQVPRDHPHLIVERSHAQRTLYPTRSTGFLQAYKDLYQTLSRLNQSLHNIKLDLGLAFIGSHLPLGRALHVRANWTGFLFGI